MDVYLLWDNGGEGPRLVNVFETLEHAKETADLENEATDPDGEFEGYALPYSVERRRVIRRGVI